MAVERELGLDREIVNVKGGGITLNHPIGNTGSRILASPIHEMGTRGLQRVLAALCRDGGGGQVIIIARVE